MSRPRIAMLAYACDPEGSGEHWLGWGWAMEAARRFDVHLFTPAKARAAIERHAGAAGITPHFVELGGAIRSVSERLGAAGSWTRKILWARKAAAQVRELHARAPFRIVHQTTFHSFRVPFYAASLGIPSVWGPIAGGEHVPPGFDELLGAAAASERSRTRINRWWLAWPAVRRALRDARAIFVSNRTTLDFLPASCRERCEIVAPNALRPEDAAPRPPRAPRAAGPLRLLYVGNCVATRCVPLVLRALVDTPTAELCVVGSGPALDAWRAEAAALGVQDRVRFAGQVARGELPAIYENADALVFPALRDSGGSALLEAMSKALPVVCLDWGGPAEMVDAESGVKVTVASPAACIEELSTAFLRLSADVAWRQSLGASAAARARSQFTWEARRQLIERTYERLLTTP